MISRETIFLRVLQIITILPCALIELINTISDIEKFHDVAHKAHQIMTNPLLLKHSIFFSRQAHFTWLPTFVACAWVTAHALFAVLLFLGMWRLLTALKHPFISYQSRKLIAVTGLILSWVWYLLMIGFFNRDFFLAWLMKQNSSAAMLDYGLPLLAALFVLLYLDRYASSEAKAY